MNRSRQQTTIARPVRVSGIGFLTGADISVQFLPAPQDHGITFLRTDLTQRIEIPASIHYTIPVGRRTTLSYRGAQIDLVEHALAALAGLGIDNCQVEVDGPELPGMDGSALAFADALYSVGLITLSVPAKTLPLTTRVSVETDDMRGSIVGQPARMGGLRLSYRLDYGSKSPIMPQSSTFEITAETFLNEIAFCRTFVLESEAIAFRNQGIGTRTTMKDLLVIGDSGPIDNRYRVEDECARHKLLDCLGDFALLGCRIEGSIVATRTGHLQNADFVRATLKSVTDLPGESGIPDRGDLASERQSRRGAA